MSDAEVENLNINLSLQSMIVINNSFCFRMDGFCRAGVIDSISFERIKCSGIDDGHQTNHLFRFLHFP